jgi:hypothetical protein
MITHNEKLYTFNCGQWLAKVGAGLHDRLFRCVRDLRVGILNHTSVVIRTRVMARSVVTCSSKMAPYVFPPYPIPPPQAAQSFLASLFAFLILVCVYHTRSGPENWQGHGYVCSGCPSTVCTTLQPIKQCSVRHHNVHGQCAECGHGCQGVHHAVWRQGRGTQASIGIKNRQF